MVANSSRKVLLVIVLVILFFSSSSTTLAYSRDQISINNLTSLTDQDSGDTNDEEDIRELLAEALPLYSKEHGFQGLTISGLTIEGDRAYAVAKVEGLAVPMSEQDLLRAHENVGSPYVPENIVGFVLAKGNDNKWTIVSDDNQPFASEVNIPVPFTPQVPPGIWGLTKNCGQTSSAMLFAYYGFLGHSPAVPQDIININSWLAQAYDDNRYLDDNGYYTSVAQLSNLAKNYAGYSNSFYGTNWTLDQLKQEINAGRPVIVAVYTNMSLSGVKHFMVLRGLRLDDSGNITHVIVNDPGRSYESGHGENYVYPVASFVSAWAGNSKAVVMVVPGGTPPPTCSAPTNGLPRDSQVVNQNTVTFSWSPPSCTGLDYYTFRVANHADIDNQPWIIDHGIASNVTSITESIPTSYNGQTLYWAIWPHNNNGYGLKGGPWSFKIDTSSPPPPPPLPTGTWNVQYFNNKELTSQCNTTSFERTFIFQDWGDGAPASGCNSNHWSARFSRQISFAGGHYDFMLEADDWARIFVDGTLVVNKWDGASQHHEGFDINAGTHEVKIEFADTEGAAKVSAWWWGPGFNVPHDTQDPNQWFANYWINQTQWWDAFANVNEGTGILNHDWGYDNPGWDMPSDNFSAKFRRVQYFECGTYRFFISHDDGAKFWLDDVLKVDRWSGAIGYYEFTLPVTRGTHLLQVDMYENGGAANIYFNWEQIGNCNPSSPSLQYPGNGASLAWNTDLTLYWNTVSEATQYLVELNGGPGEGSNSGWLSGTQWYLGRLYPGTYTWKVTARNDNGSSSPSPTWTFTIQEPPPSPPQSQSLYLPAIFRGAQGQWNTILYEGFEGVFPGNWNILDSSGLGYQWKDRSCLSSTGSWSAWAMGGGTNGSTLPCGSSYINDANTWLYIGPFNLSNATQAELKFDLWLNTEMEYDFLHWGASDDGYAFKMVKESGNTNGWVSRSLDLSNVNGQNFVGQSQVWIGFLFTSDYSINYPTGAAIDEVVLRKCVGGVCQ